MSSSDPYDYATPSPPVPLLFLPFLSTLLILRFLFYRRILTYSEMATSSTDLDIGLTDPSSQITSTGGATRPSLMEKLKDQFEQRWLDYYFSHEELSGGRPFDQKSLCTAIADAWSTVEPLIKPRVREEEVRKEPYINPWDIEHTAIDESPDTGHNCLTRIRLKEKYANSSGPPAMAWSTWRLYDPNDPRCKQEM